jgi:type IV pilus assembly protein PilC
MGGVNIKKSKKISSEKDVKFDINGFFNKEILFFGNKLSDKKKEQFFLELGILVKAGLDIKSCFDLLVLEQKHGKDRNKFELIRDNIIKGLSLSDALKTVGGFSDYEIISLKIGEETGKIGVILEELAGFYKGKIKQKRQAISALSYPLIVLVTSAGVLIFMLNVIVPMFGEVFKNFGGELPYLTKVVIELSNIFKKYIWLMISVLIIMLLVINSQKKKEWFRKYYSLILLRIPVLGELVRKIYLARFCHILHLLLTSKIPLLESIGLIKKMIHFFPIEHSLIFAERKILLGESLSQSLSKFNVYHRKMIALLRVGEDVNKLDEFLLRLSEQYTEDVEHQSKILSSLIEPVLMIFLGLVVGVILVAMYLPMFKLSTFF